MEDQIKRRIEINVRTREIIDMMDTALEELRHLGDDLDDGNTSYIELLDAVRGLADSMEPHLNTMFKLTKPTYDK